MQCLDNKRWGNLPYSPIFAVSRSTVYVSPDTGSVMVNSMRVLGSMRLQEYGKNAAATISRDRTSAMRPRITHAWAVRRTCSMPCPTTIPT